MDCIAMGNLIKIAFEEMSLRATETVVGSVGEGSGGVLKTRMKFSEDTARGRQCPVLLPN